MDGTLGVLSFGLFLLPSRLSREEEKERKKKIKYEQKKTDKIQRKTPIFTIYLTVQSAFVSRHYKTSIGSARSGYPVEGAAALGFRAGILRSSSGVK